MAIIQAVDNGALVDNYTSEESTVSNDLGYDQFLQLLCAEMRYQDPLEPTTNTEYVAQLATFSQMEAMLNMQSSIESSTANGLVGKYVIIQSDGMSPVAGYVDFVHYENGKQFVSVNGVLYSVADIYEVVDPEYMEAVALAEAFAASVKNLPDVDDLTLAWEGDITSLATVYNSMTAYQQSYIPTDVLQRFTALVNKMTELKKAAAGDSDTEVGDTETPSEGTDGDTEVDGTESPEAGGGAEETTE